jgi:fluoroacetyl-CoA thioesterase
MSGPHVGLSATIDLTVTEADTAISFGSGDVRVLATPRVVALVEEAAVAALAGHLTEGFTTVGTRIHLDHVAPSPVGSTVTATAEVVDVERRTIVFEVQTTMGDQVVARGEHTRVSVERERFDA